MKYLKWFFAVVFPPIAVIIHRGIGVAAILSFVFTILWYIPGIIHAIWVLSSLPAKINLNDKPIYSIKQKIYFIFVIILLNLSFSIPYPVTIAASAMAAGGYIPEDTNFFIVFFSRLVWILILFYPFVSLIIYYIGLKIVMKKKNKIGYFISILPIIIIISFIVYMNYFL